MNIHIRKFVGLHFTAQEFIEQVYVPSIRERRPFQFDYSLSPLNINVLGINVYDAVYEFMGDYYPARTFYEDVVIGELEIYHVPFMASVIDGRVVPSYFMDADGPDPHMFFYAYKWGDRAYFYVLGFAPTAYTESFCEPDHDSCVYANWVNFNPGDQLYKPDGYYLGGMLLYPFIFPTNYQAFEITVPVGATVCTGFYKPFILYGVINLYEPVMVRCLSGTEHNFVPGYTRGITRPFIYSLFAHPFEFTDPLETVNLNGLPYINGYSLGDGTWLSKIIWHSAFDWGGDAYYDIALDDVPHNEAEAAICNDLLIHQETGFPIVYHSEVWIDYDYRVRGEDMEVVFSGGWFFYDMIFNKDRLASIGDQVVEPFSFRFRGINVSPTLYYLILWPRWANVETCPTLKFEHLISCDSSDNCGGGSGGISRAYAYGIYSHTGSTGYGIIRDVFWPKMVAREISDIYNLISPVPPEDYEDYKEKHESQGNVWWDFLTNYPALEPYFDFSIDLWTEKREVTLESLRFLLDLGP